MRLFWAQPFLFLALAAAQLAAPDWKTLNDYPNIDFTGLTAAQKNTALTVLRGTGCACGCGMMIAECRIKDPACGDSRALAEIAIKAIKENKDPKKAISESDLVKRHNAPTALLEEPIYLPIDGAP